MGTGGRFGRDVVERTRWIRVFVFYFSFLLSLLFFLFLPCTVQQRIVFPAYSRSSAVAVVCREESARMLQEKERKASRQRRSRFAGFARLRPAPPSLLFYLPSLRAHLASSIRVSCSPLELDPHLPSSLNFRLFQLPSFSPSPLHFHRMSTQIPPAPKRVRRIGPNAVIAQENLNAPVHTVVCQFRNAQDGTLLGPVVSLPADTGREGLELLVNNLRGSVRFAFHSLSRR
jgi:hypothetical protein